MADDNAVPDLSGAEVYVEASEPAVAGGWWYILPDRGDGAGERVVYRRPDGRIASASVLDAATLRGSSTWRRADPPPG